MFDTVPSDATGYVAAAYMVFLLLVLVYIGIIGIKFQRVSRDLGELIEEVEAGQAEAAGEPGADDEPEVTGGDGVAPAGAAAAGQSVPDRQTAPE